jgi:hypothetical protein
MRIHIWLKKELRDKLANWSALNGLLEELLTEKEYRVVLYALLDTLPGGEEE